MTATDKPEAIKAYLRFCLLSSTVVLLLVGVGFWPSKHLGGSEAVTAMLAGCAVCLLASWCGGLPIVLTRNMTSAAIVNAALGSMLARLVAILVFGTITVLSGWFERTPLLVWIGIGYVAMLVPDTLFTLQSAKSLSKQPPVDAA